MRFWTAFTNISHVFGKKRIVFCLSSGKRPFKHITNGCPLTTNDESKKNGL